MNIVLRWLSLSTSPSHPLSINWDAKTKGRNTHTQRIIKKSKRKMRASRVGMILMTIGVILLISKSDVVVMVEGAEVSCNPMQMSSCMNSIISGTPPSKQCCSKIKEQRPCLCGYLKNPFLKNFVDSPNARKVATDCGTPFPTCWIIIIS